LREIFAAVVRFTAADFLRDDFLNTAWCRDCGAPRNRFLDGLSSLSAPMKTLNIILAVLLTFAALPPRLKAGETKTLIGVPSADTLTLGEGESAKLTFRAHWAPSFPNTGDVLLQVQIAGKTFRLEGELGEGPFEISGPVAIKVLPSELPNGITLATFAVTRVGIASEPACIPQEAGSNFNVILESSSDLVNWTPANPGSYPGLETKRFFRTRIVKQ
jgi:hypothetical protein